MTPTYSPIVCVAQSEVTVRSPGGNAAETIEETNRAAELIDKRRIRRPRSAGDISETLHQCTCTLATVVAASAGGISTYPGGESGQSPEGNQIVSSTAFSRTNCAPPSAIDSTKINNNNNITFSTNGGGKVTGGILSFFKFKSGGLSTKHLDKPSCHNRQGHECVDVVSEKGVVSLSGGIHSANKNRLNSGISDLRYTKFPLSHGKNSAINSRPVEKAPVVAGGALSDDGSSSGGGNNVNLVTDICPSPLCSANRHKPQLCHSLEPSPASQVDPCSAHSSCDTNDAGGEPTEFISKQPFEESQIQFTPQTRTYGHPHKSPLPHPHHQNALPSSSTSAGNFLANTVSSIGRKVVNSVTLGSKNKHNSRNKSKLKVKSKSDNNLHRVNSNVNANSVLGASTVQCCRNAGGVPRNASATTFTSYLTDNQNESDGSQQRLNSVQLGDHATIRLPWTGFQQINNLSSVSSPRAFIPHTHNNNFEFLPASSSSIQAGSERYVECGSSILRTATAAIPGVLSSSHCGPSSLSTSSRHQAFPTRRRSRSLERCSNLRVFPKHTSSSGVTTTTSLSSNPSRELHHSHLLTWRAIESQTNGGSLLSRSQSRKETGSEKEEQRTRSAHSLERNTCHNVRQALTPTEQEILLRNIDWNSGRDQQPEPPRRPEKPSKLSNSIFQAFQSSDYNSGCKSRSQHQRRHPLENIHRSAPSSSFSNSSESGESSYSAPPSPPPRPPSTLKPNGRLIIHHPSSHAASSTLRQHHFIPANPTTAGSLSPSSTGGGSCSSGSTGPGIIMMNPTPKRKPVGEGRSHGSSSDSGVSHVSSSNTTVRGTSDFSDESAGSLNISQHSSSQHSASGMTTSSSGVSHQPSSSAAIHSTNNQNNTIISSSTQSTGAAATATPTTTTNTAAPVGISIEDVRNSGFINKPSKGWLHSDQMLSKEGATYTVRYIGCLDVNTSMKSLDFDTRSLIAKECINQVCEAAGLRSQDKKKKVDRRVIRILGMRPRLEHAGSDVRLTITSTCLKLTSLDTGAVIAVHDMPNISFASGGDATMLDFVAYVAKDAIVGRACFVLECGSGLAQDVITTVGQAFELRFKEYLQKRPPPPRIPMDDPEYYNDLPGKVPPDLLLTDSKDKIQNVAGKGKSATSSRAKEPPPLNLHSTSDKELSVNLIDFEAPTPPAFGPSVEDKQLDSFLLPGSDNHNGANNLGASVDLSNHSVMGTGLGLPNSPSQPQPKDPFDMQPFATTLPQSIPPDVVADQRRLLGGEIWFHGTVSRGEAEELLKHDGDFLVRESMACPGQFVLTGLQGGSPKHLLLVDPEGIVRTKDSTFDNVTHLIKYHSDNCLPIISAESMVLLRNAVTRVISSTSPSS